MFSGIDTAARRTWLTSPYNSARGKPSVIRYSNTTRSIARFQATRLRKVEAGCTRASLRTGCATGIKRDRVCLFVGVEPRAQFLQPSEPGHLQFSALSLIPDP